MTSNRTEQFATALNELEAGGDIDQFTSVFADGAELHRPEKGERRDGEAGARDFWQNYLSVFSEIRSDFSRVVDGEVGVLEWVSNGKLRDGSPISYAGTSLLDFDDDDRVTRFATYYDTQAFTPGSGRVS